MLMTGAFFLFFFCSTLERTAYLKKHNSSFSEHLMRGSQLNHFHQPEALIPELCIQALHCIFASI